MIVVYDRNTHEIVGHCATIFDNGKSREASIAELFPEHDPNTLDALYVKDDPRFLYQGAGSYRIAQDQNGVVTGIERLPRVMLSCDAQDSDGDGVPDLPAQTDAATTITATLAGGKGVTVTFQTTRGALAQRTAVADASGKATVKLNASTETAAAHVTATAPNYLAGSLSIEFSPPTPAPSKPAKTNPSG